MRVTEGAFVADPVLHGSVHLSSSRSSRRDSVPPSKRASRKRGTKAKSPQVGEYDGGRTLPSRGTYAQAVFVSRYGGPVFLTLRRAGEVGLLGEVTGDGGFAVNPVCGRGGLRRRGGERSGIGYRGR